MVRHRYDPGRFVLVSVDAIDAAWHAAGAEQGLYVGAGGAGSDHSSEYAVAKRDVAAGSWTPPIVGFVGGDKIGVVFTTGRYHFAAARDLGRRSVTVEAGPEQATLFREKFGA